MILLSQKRMYSGVLHVDKYFKQLLVSNGKCRPNVYICDMLRLIIIVFIVLLYRYKFRAAKHNSKCGMIRNQFEQGRKMPNCLGDPLKIYLLVNTLEYGNANSLCEKNTFAILADMCDTNGNRRAFIASINRIFLISSKQTYESFQFLFLHTIDNEKYFPNRKDFLCVYFQYGQLIRFHLLFEKNMSRCISNSDQVFGDL